ncbi:hypothetical protein O1D97_01005 [Marinomonas sp. 15G1-11]|uniref:Uncharacterized protein n=1 Tax=Marinomonas phaeophyticola TaxID=3004091 RepID=A0ABT4JPV1_9GAMM|nr:hypothetical protein [Marinomonas sp. 15G1-11]MCZ2720255.1 hypothetical protein [Marinomonas sp. 15G1-11]
MISFVKDNRDTLIVALLVLVCWLGFIDRYAEAYINRSISTSLLSFGVAKAFNATISVLSTITLQVPLIGSIQIGELLDPLNDLVEDFSTIMKYSISSLLIQKFIVEILQTIHFKLFLTLSACVFISTKYYFNGFRVLSYKVFVFALACKFSIALVAVASSFVDSAFINDHIEKENHTLDAFPVSTSQLNQQLDLTSEIKQQLKIEMQQKQAEIRVQSIEIEELIAEEELLELEMSQLNESILESTAGTSLLNKFINRSPELAVLHEQRVTLRSKLYVLKNQIENAQDAIRDKQEEYESLERQYQEDGVSTYQSLKGGLSKFAFAAKNKIVDFVDSLNLASDNFLNLMALFIFKTMLIPLAFLLGMYKVFKAIWGMTPAVAVKQIRENMSTVTS